jgi:hypothetical protein
LETRTKRGFPHFHSDHDGGLLTSTTPNPTKIGVSYRFLHRTVKAYYPYLTVLLVMFAVMIVMIFVLTFFLFLVKASLKMSWFKNVDQKRKDTLTMLIALALFVGCGALAAHFVHKP